MSTKTDLTAAQNAVIDAARKLCDRQRYLNEDKDEPDPVLDPDGNRIHDRHMALVMSTSPTGRLYQALIAYDKVAADLTGERATNKTHTSIAAAKTLPGPSTNRRAVLELLWRLAVAHGASATTDQLEHRLGKSHQTVSSAVNYLHEHGLIRQDGYFPTRTGRKAISWTVTETGRTLMNTEPL